MITIIPIPEISLSNLRFIKTMLRHDEILMVETIYTLHIILFEVNFHFFKYYEDDSGDDMFNFDQFEDNQFVGGY